MRRLPSFALLLAVAAPTFAANPNSAYYTAPQEIGAEVSILALSSTIRHGWSGNQEIYVADVSSKAASHRLARLVDIYPSDDQPIQFALLADRQILSMRLLRTPECDIPSAEIFLPADERFVFDAGARTSLKQHTGKLVPCFHVIHEATRVKR